MLCADYIATVLKSKGVTQVFELSGGMIAYLLDSFCRLGGVEVVSVRHEQAAAFAADAYGRITGVPGVALATSGPGATNLLTGIGSCYFDSSPAVFITGQVNRNEQKKHRNIRQLGFQETDIVSMARPITKEAHSVNTVEEVPGLLDRAFRVALSGRPGPVLLDIPMDVQRSDLPLDASLATPSASEPASESEAPSIEVGPLLDALRGAARPLILAGGGIRASRATAAFRKVVDLLRVPVVHSLMGVDLLPFSHPLRVGMIGTYGNRWANIALTRSDLLIVLGSRLDVRQTGSRTDAFKQGREIFHVDCERDEMNNRVAGCHAIECGLADFLPSLLAAHPDSPNGAHSEPWLQEIAELRATYPDTAELQSIAGINPNRFIHELSRSSGSAGTFVADVGQHQMWAAQSLELTGEQRFLTSGGMGSMGFGLPAALGACLASGRAPTVLIAGDGGFQCNIQELETVSHLRLPLKMVILNNRCHGMVRQFQESYFEGRYQSTWWGYSAPDFARVAEGYGIAAASIDDPDQVDGAIRNLLQREDQPGLLQVMIDPMANAYPKVAFGQPISEMEPFAEALEVEST